MTSFSAKPFDNERLPLPVLFVIYPNIVLLDLSGPLQVFAGAKHAHNGALAYRTAIASVTGGPIQTDTVVAIESEPIESWVDREIHTLVVVGGNGANAAMKDARLIENVSVLAERAERVCSVCSGALILAEAGLLQGRRATTHWDDCAHLERDFPETTVEVDPIYIKDGPVWTSAGITAGIDMSLAIVAEDLGTPPAIELAQSLLAYMVRPGGQSQFSPVLMRQRKDRSGRFDDLHKWIADNLQRDIRTEELADRAGMSLRNFHRQYSATMGITPAKAVETIRVERARELLETTDHSMKVIANQCGFGEEERMRRAFIRLTHINPSDYRQRFQFNG
ncbi:MAG: helix-turn-helix domain-containing protein [Pseudomonadota bacterium]